MYDIALQIKAKDWLYILLIGVVFGMFLSSLGYSLLEEYWLDGALYGVLLGFSITLFSLVFISFMNRYILPKLRPRYWLVLAIVFSFLSGFLGTLFGTLIARIFELKLLDAFVHNLIWVAVSIGVLTYIVGALLYRFVRMRNEKERVDSEYIQSRLRSLETQLNPHFLFNALNSIAELIHQDKDKAELAILKVSAFLRNTMNESALISLAEELRNVSDYVELENIRFSGKIKLHNPSLIPHYNLPKFSIQLLVENAIKHGYDGRGELNIFIETNPSQKSIRVKNDGRAMQSKKFGIGLNNLKQRLELLCHGDIVIQEIEQPTFDLYIGDCNENTSSR
jgi:two-component system, LytTR family, sensor kinase